eukprot:1226497-Rhodomonas_salina.2
MPSCRPRPVRPRDRIVLIQPLPGYPRVLQYPGTPGYLIPGYPGTGFVSSSNLFLLVVLPVHLSIGVSLFGTLRFKLPGYPGTTTRMEHDSNLVVPISDRIAEKKRYPGTRVH